MPTLHEAIAERKSQILSCFEARVRRAGLIPESQPAQILDNVPTVLDEMIVSLQRCHEHGRGPDEKARAARSHGQHRHATAVSLESVVREYGILRDCILVTAEGAGVVASAREFSCLAAYIEDAMCEAIREYAAHRDSDVMRERSGLDAERRRLRTMIALLPVGVMLCDKTGRSLEVNRAMRSLWASQKEPLREPVADATYKAWEPESGEAIPFEDSPCARALRNGETTVNREMDVETGDGARKTILASSAPTRDEVGEIDGAVVVHVDISAQALALRQSKLAVRAREEVLAVVAHDLKNPLNSILIAASRLGRSIEAEAAAKVSEMIVRAVKRMDRLVSDLLQLAQIEAGHLTLEREKLDLRALVREAIEAIGPLVQAKGVWLEKEHCEAGVPLVECDRERIHRVMANLLGNAVKFTPEGGSIFVRLSSEPRRVIVEVADTGQGIPPAELPHVFERFWHAHDASRAGHGLGLAIVRGIVEAHGGETWVTSNVGVGSSFFFSLPIGVAGSNA